MNYLEQPILDNCDNDHLSLASKVNNYDAIKRDIKNGVDIHWPNQEDESN